MNRCGLEAFQSFHRRQSPFKKHCRNVFNLGSVQNSLDLRPQSASEDAKSGEKMVRNSESGEKKRAKHEWRKSKLEKIIYMRPPL